MISAPPCHRQLHLSVAAEPRWVIRNSCGAAFDDGGYKRELDVRKPPLTGIFRWPSENAPDRAATSPEVARRGGPSRR